MGRNLARLLALLLLVLVGHSTIGCTEVGADYYKYTNSRGAVCIGTSIDAVPHDIGQP